jgi:hypothetical protein
MNLVRQLLACAVAWLAATVANVGLYFGLRDLAGVPFVAPEGLPSLEVVPLPYTDVIIFSGVFSVGASLVFLGVANLTRRPALIFTVISVVVLVLSFLLPLMIPLVPLSTKLGLVAMHILGAAVLVPLLIVIGLPRTGR